MPRCERTAWEGDEWQLQLDSASSSREDIELPTPRGRGLSRHLHLHADLDDHDVNSRESDPKIVKTISICTSRKVEV